MLEANELLTLLKELVFVHILKIHVMKYLEKFPWFYNLERHYI